MKKKEKTPLKEKFIPKTNLEKTLCAIFIFLFIVVIVLALGAVKAKKESQQGNVDAVVPIIEETKTALSVDVSNLTSGNLKEYKFKITNYTGKTINKNKTDYKIVLDTKDNNVTYSLYKNSDNVNLYQKSAEHTDTLNSKSKVEDTYYLIIKANEDIEINETLTLNIIS